MSDTDFAALIEPVARHFWGDPNKTHSTRLSLRWGSQGSRKVDLDGDGLWRDFETDESGGVIKLVMRETGADKAGAIEWLQSEGFIEARDREKSPYPPQNGSNGANGRHSPPAPPPPLDEPQGEIHVDEPQGQKKAVCGYDYTDRDGNLLYQVLRYQWAMPDGSWLIDPKTGNPKKAFRQRRKGENGEIIWNLDGIGHTLYRHPAVEIAIAEGKTVFLPEGEKDVDTLAEWGLAATTNSGGAQHWQPHLIPHFRDADVVILIDNDDAGIKRGEEVAKSLRGIAKRIRVLNLADHVPGFPPKGDVTDWRDRFGGDASQLVEKINKLPDWRPCPPVSRLDAIQLQDVGKEAETHQWLVQDMIELGGTCAFAGFSQSGKSFLMIELAFAIAMGKPFWGRDVKQGLVIYQTGEGAKGLMKRVQGYVADRGVEDPSKVPMVIIPRKINLFQSDTDTDDLIAACKGWQEYHQQPLRMIVIDTFNKATRGANEISGLDMGKVIDRLERIASECECTVAVVDHLSAQGKFRGHGSKTGDMTNVIMISVDDRKTDRNGRKIRRMHLDKNKDGENGKSIGFVLRQVVLGFDEQGHPVTTCVVEPPDGDDEELAKSGRLPLTQALMLRILRDLIDREGEPPADGVIGVPKGRRVVKWKAFVEELRKKWGFADPETEPEKRQAELFRVLQDGGKKLQLAGYIDRDNVAKVCWWTGKDDRPRVDAKAAEKAPPLPAGVREELGALTEAPF